MTRHVPIRTIGPSRRLGVGLLVLALAGSPLGAQEGAATEVRERILVVGAGFSGLTAARLLADSGFDVTVVEARDRVGGRAWTRTVAETPLELGAMFLHGTKGNPAAQIADAEGLAYRAREMDLAVAFDAVEGRRLTEEERLSLLVVAGAFEGQTSRLREQLDSDASAAAAIELFLDQRRVAGDERRRQRFGLEQILFELYDSGPVDTTAIAHVDVYQELGGGDQLLEGGYRRLADLLAEGLDIRLETAVERIEYGAAGAKVITREGVFDADRVLVTVSQGVLESGSIAFDPPLPQRRRDAIARLDMGNLEKVVFIFETAFWRERDDRSLSVVYLGDPPGEVPACLDFTDHVGKPSLTCLYGGRSARNILETRSKAEIEARALAVLREIFGEDSPDPVAVVSSNWWQDPFTLGSYSYLPVGADPADMRELGEPIGDRLFFAGEATVPEYYGTVHAAILSGIREAERLGATRTTVRGLCGYLPDC